MRRLVIATTLLICLALASQARAAAPRAFYGVIPANDPDSTEIARMGAGRVGTLRINFVWGAVQPAGGAPYDWSHYDASDRRGRPAGDPCAADGLQLTQLGRREAQLPAVKRPLG